MPDNEISQEEVALQVLGDWCKRQPGRRVVVQFVDPNWRVVLEHGSTLHVGEPLVDALSQAAQYVVLLDEP